MKRLWIIWLLWLAGQAGHALGETAPILDRLLFEVNKMGYSQRFFETYSVVKELISSPTGGEITYPNAVSWSQLLEKFKVDMLVEQEAKRLGGLNIDKNITNKAHTMIFARKLADPRFAAFLRHLAASDDSLRRAALSVITIKLFLLRKQGDLKEIETAAGVFGKVVVDEKAAWYIKLEQQTTYRFFENADTYVEISPVRMGEQSP